MLELWTHGIYKATPHRVRNLKYDDRNSLVYFFDPNYKSHLEKIDMNDLRTEDLKTAEKDDRRKRWDNIDLKHLCKDMIFGEQLEFKYKNLFLNMQ